MMMVFTILSTLILYRGISPSIIVVLYAFAYTTNNRSIRVRTSRTINSPSCPLQAPDDDVQLELHRVVGAALLLSFPSQPNIPINRATVTHPTFSFVHQHTLYNLLNFPSANVLPQKPEAANDSQRNKYQHGFY